MAGLILVCGLSAFTVFLLTGATYMAAGLYFRLPVPVQPLKAMAVIAIAGGVSAKELAAGGVIMGAILLFLSATNIASRLSVLFAPWTVKGVQLAVGLMLIKSSFSFVDGSYGAVWKAAMPLDLKGAAALLLAAAAILLLLLFRYNQKVPAVLVVVVLGLGLGFVAAGPAAIGSLTASAHRFTSLSIPDPESFTHALFLLVIPQLPLTFGNAVIATTDVARSYFKDGARRVTPKALCASLGIANTMIGLWGGMPICHGSGGMTAHYRLGARSGAAPLLIGAILIVLAV
jgi:SulP family sulfate permease